jgi:EmrB/QacA subfamily drug resistance transporter
MSPEPPQPELTRRLKFFTLAGTLLGLFLAALDQTIVATAGPVIQQDLHIEPAMYAWITTAYLVASTVFVPIFGKLSDIFGRKPILLVGMFVFLLGSLLCGLAISATTLVIFRAIQGAGSAALFTTAFAVIADLYPPSERAKYTGLFGGVFGLSSVIGPLAGGFITDHFGWHWAFFVNLPIGAIAIGFVVARMPVLAPARREKVSIDFAGALALACTVVPLLVALTLGSRNTADQRDWASGPVLGLLAVAAFGLAAFLLIERRAADPILDLRLFRNRVFAAGNAAAFVIGMTFLSAVVFLPLFMVNVVGLSATGAGLTTTPLTLGIVAGNILSGQLVSRVGRYKPIMLVSLVMMCAAFAVMGFGLSPDSTQAEVTRKMIFVGLALGPSIPLYALAIQNGVTPQQIGAATASATFFRQMGSTLGVTVVGAVFASTLATGLHDQLARVDADIPPDLRDQLLTGRGGEVEEGPSQTSFDVERVHDCIQHHYETERDHIATTVVDPHEQAVALESLARDRDARMHSVDELSRAAKVAFTTAIERIYRVCVGFALLALLITLALPELPLRRTMGPPVLE